MLLSLKKNHSGNKRLASSAAKCVTSTPGKQQCGFGGSLQLGNLRYNSSLLVFAEQLLRLEQIWERRAAGYSTPDHHVWRSQVVEHPGRLIGISRRHRNIQHPI